MFNESVAPILESEPIQPEQQEKKEKEVTFEILNDPEFRKVLWDRVNRLVSFAGKQRFGTPSFLFLDKSARPLAWLLRERWKNRFPDKELPRTHFAAIGRKQTLESDHDNTYLQMHRDMTDVLYESDGMSREQMYAKYRDPMQMYPARGPDMDWLKQRFFQWSKRRGDSAVEEGFHSDAQMLRDRYKGQFEDKKVVVVDDYAEVGTSKILAELMLQEAFPEASVSGTHLFNGEEKSKIPWLQTQGLAGVIEFAGDDSLLASPLSREGFDKIKEEVASRVTKEAESLQANLGYVEEGLAAIIRESEQVSATETGAQSIGEKETFAGLADEARELIAVVARIRAAGTLEDRLPLYLELERESYSLFKNVSLATRTYPVHAELWAPRFFVGGDFVNAVQISDSLTSFEDVKAKADQLRKELKALAKLNEDEL